MWDSTPVVFDRMAFAVRRLICPPDERWMPGREPGTPTFTNRELLTRQPEHHGGLGRPLDLLISAKKPSPAREAALNLNVPFAPNGYRHEPTRSGSASRNPVIIRGILDPLGSDDPRRAAEGVDVARWFLANVQVARGKAADPSVGRQI